MNFECISTSTIPLTEDYIVLPTYLPYLLKMQERKSTNNESFKENEEKCKIA